MLRKKSLGQHFLYSAHYLKLILDTAQVGVNDLVLEIGPGDGALTTLLLQRGAHVVAVEKDSRLIALLKEKFESEIASGSLALYEADALHFDISKCKEIKNKKYKVVANIPYYITGVLLRKLFSQTYQPSEMTLLVQKEVAERIARSAKESILSLSVKVYGTPRYIKTVPRGAFAPPPGVDSSILRIENISRKNFATTQSEKKFFNTIKAGFAQKRKLLKRNLEAVFGKKSSDILENVGISQNARAEDVELAQWLKLTAQG